MMMKHVSFFPCRAEEDFGGGDHNLRGNAAGGRLKRRLAVERFVGG